MLSSGLEAVYIIHVWIICIILPSDIFMNLENLAKSSCNSQHVFAFRQFPAAICSRLSPRGDHALRVAGDFRPGAIMHCNLQETFASIQ